MPTELVTAPIVADTAATGFRTTTGPPKGGPFGRQCAELLGNDAALAALGVVGCGDLATEHVLDEVQQRLLVGSWFRLTGQDGEVLSLLAIAQNRNGYGNLSETITLGRTRAAKGEYLFRRLREVQAEVWPTEDFELVVSHVIGHPLG